VLWLAVLIACARAPVAPVETARPPVATARAEPARTGADQAPADGAADARHLLERFAFGPKPGDVEIILAEGRQAWFEHQLRADELPDPRGDRAVLPYRRALVPPERLPDLFGHGGLSPEASAEANRWQQSREVRRQTSTRQLLLELQMAEIVRHVASEYQLREVMVDFWTNHFNVYAKKEEVQLLAGDYVQRVIRTGALGRFEDLLVGTARHPAMLRYLDNASSRAKVKGGGRKGRGVSENYARELLELHTLGVDGGYEQSDVIAVARILTGWTFEPGPAGRGYAYRFDPRVHDREAKTVLGVEFAPGGEEDEGIRLLGLLARHPATAEHLARKLCVRFVADEAPAECIEVTSQAFLATDGSIKATLQALFGSRSFWAAENRRSKLKTPLEFMVSAVRGVDARLAGTTELARIAARLGEAPFALASPTGRREDTAYWLESFTLARLGFAHDVAFGRVPGVVLAEAEMSADPAETERVMFTLCQQLLGGHASEQTRLVIEQALSADPHGHAGFSSGLALALSSPEFQWR